MDLKEKEKYKTFWLKEVIVEESQNMQREVVEHRTWNIKYRHATWNLNIEHGKLDIDMQHEI